MQLLSVGYDGDDHQHIDIGGLILCGLQLLCSMYQWWWWIVVVSLAIAWANSSDWYT